MKKVLFFLLLTAGFAFQATAQIQTPQPSPSAKIMQTVGLTDITVEYSRPSIKGRTIFADNGLVPYGKVWRTGANSATKVTLSTDAKMGGVDVKAGTYAMFTKPSAGEWTVMLFEHTTASAGGYGDATPAAEFKAKSMELPMTVESFMIAFDGLTNESAQMMLAWEKTAAVIDIDVPSEKMAMASIERTMAGPSMNDYYAAAGYYHAAGKDLKQAHEWVSKVNKDNARFWTLRLQSEIEADLGMKKEAIATAKKSLEMAKEAGNQDYIKINTDNIKKWSM